MPTEADFVLAYATVPGYVSWRNSEYGSWFIKAFVDTMYEMASKEHLMDILVEVNRRVAEEFQSKGRNKQIPSP
ncbi:caspase family protein, partial [Lacisediminihabitans profunda]|uniref:caspase family protein n=1 Tax=Lacisediminihabitans profunda TaxID=2594790 RepID=UPI003CCC5682